MKAPLIVLWVAGCYCASAWMAYWVVQIHTSGPPSSRALWQILALTICGSWVATVGWVPSRWRRHIGLLGTLAAVFFTGGVYFDSCSREMQTYRLAAQELVSSLQLLQSDVRPPAQLQEDLDLSTGQWRRLSQSYSPLCGHLASYRLLDLSLQEHLQGVKEFRQALGQRRSALARATRTVDAPSPATASPEADRAYQKALLESKRQAQPAIRAAKKKAKAGLNRAVKVEQAAQVARTRVQEAEKRMKQAQDNRYKSWSGPSAADVFSAEYNSNKDPDKAMDAMFKQESVYRNLVQEATRLALQAQELQQEVTTLEEESESEAIKKAEAARQKVWDRFDKARLQAQRDAMDREYLRWYNRVDSQRLEHWDRAAQHLRAAESALAQENTWQALTQRTSKTPLAVESTQRQPAPRSTPPSPYPTPAATVAGTGILVKKIDQDFRVLFVAPGSPANRAGIQRGDSILRIGEEPLDEETLDQAKSLLAKQVEGEIEICFSRGAQIQQATLSPDPLAEIHPSPARDPFNKP